MAMMCWSSELDTVVRVVKWYVLDVLDAVKDVLVLLHPLLLEEQEVNGCGILDVKVNLVVRASELDAVVPVVKVLYLMLMSWYVLDVDVV
eukprot:6470839-Amphidinium_carterae.1